MSFKFWLTFLPLSFSIFWGHLGSRSRVREGTDHSACTHRHFTIQFFSWLCCNIAIWKEHGFWNHRHGFKFCLCQFITNVSLGDLSLQSPDHPLTPWSSLFLAARSPNLLIVPSVWSHLVSSVGQLIDLEVIFWGRSRLSPKPASSLSQLTLSRQCKQMQCFTFHLINPQRSSAWPHLLPWLALISNYVTISFLECFKYLRNNIPQTEGIFHLYLVCFPEKSIPPHIHVILAGPSFSFSFYIWSNTQPCWLSLCSNTAWSEPIFPHLCANWETWARESPSMSVLWRWATSRWWSSSSTHSLLTLLLSSCRLYYNFWIRPEPGPRNPWRGWSYWGNIGRGKAVSLIKYIFANPIPCDCSNLSPQHLLD